MNIQPNITINGVNSLSIQGLMITELPPITKAPKRVLIEAIDGKDGDTITDLGYSAYDKPLKIALVGAFDIDSIIKFFDSEGVITFSNEPDKYYRFTIYEQIDFARLLRFKTAEINIHVQPFKFSTLEEPIEFDVGASPNEVSVFNAGNTISKPTITITGSGDLVLSINGVELLNISLDALGETIIIDTEEMNAYAENGAFLNRQVIGNYDNIKLITGENSIVITGTITALAISKYSRWL